MNSLFHIQRRAACGAAIITTTALPRRLPPHLLLPRTISSTSHLPAPKPAAAGSSEEPKTAQKKANKVKKGPSSANLAAKEAKSAKMAETMAKAIDAPMRKPPPASDEEMERRYNIGRTYVIESFKRHNRENHDLANKIRMKRHAMNYLPREGEIGDEVLDGKSVYGTWRSEAEKINMNWGPPDHRPIPMHTPPIEGFDITQYMDQEDED
mmetsp:Transcript_8208/g.17748  ORF Transcript_8208/g.17748 Transcript_8208/m.17748 type:complete len:210 (-) Transcript_8208:258-887(-)